MSARRGFRTGSALRAALAGAALAAVFAVGAVAPAHALKVTTYNILSYPDLSLSTRQPHFRTIMSNLDTDILVVQELKTLAGADSFLTNVLNVVQPGQWARTNFFADAEGCAYYKPAKVTLVTAISFGVGGPRTVLLARFRPVGFTTNNAAFRVYSVHLKAGDTPSDITTRATECTNLRNQLDLVTEPFIVGGDYNMPGSSEAGFVKLIETHVAPDNGRCVDPILQYGFWNDNPAFASIHTQSPCLSCPAGFSAGGMDDRFDIWLVRANMLDGEGWDYVPGGYVAYGNDGQHLNKDINGDGFNNAVGLTVANALHDAADHLPVIMTLQTPAKVSTVSQLDFGDYIVGGATYNGIFIENGMPVPADELTFSFTAPAGFGAQPGTFQQFAGAAPEGYEITMDTATPGVKTGTLLINSDDPDTSSKQVLLSGRVLDHAAASLDSLVTLTGEILQFGAHVPGGFQDMDVRVHNPGYHPLQARLSLNAANFTGSPRFSVDGGFTPGLIAGTAKTLSIHFDDTGADLDSTYTGTLTLQSADEPLEGGTSKPDLVVHLSARVVSSTTDAPAAGPAAVRFYPPSPNPTAHGSRFAFDLPRAADVTLELHDLSGRRVGTLASGGWSAGRHAVTWNGLDDDGRRVPAGLYFARFVTAGYDRIERIVVLK